MSGVSSLVRHLGNGLALNVKRIFNGRLVDVLAGWYFDWRHNVDTGGKITLDRLRIDSENKKDGVFYSPSLIGLFGKMMDAVETDFSGYTFVDYGCGKGRTLLLASHYPFRRIIGIDFAESLCAIANRNIRTFRGRNQRCHDIVALTMDATRFEIPPGPAVLYFFNPFGEAVMRPVLDRIEQASRSGDHPLHIVYYNPVCAQLFDQSDQFRRVVTGKRFAIWSNV